MVDVSERHPASASGAVLLEARSVRRRARQDGRWLLADASIEVRGGARLAIVGATGSGKTLLLRALARLDPVDGGEVLWQGHPISGDEIPRFRRDAMYVHQRPTLMDGSVEDNLRLPFSLAVHRGRRFSRDAVLPLFDRVDRDVSFLSKLSRDLSGGEAQITAMVRAIQLEPTVLLLDEPTAALDEASKRLIEELVIVWHGDSPGTRAFVWVSHDREQVERVAGQVLRMHDGRLGSVRRGDVV